MAEGQSLTVEGLRRAVEAGEIDTVTVCTPDLNGKLMGKRVPAAAFVDDLPRGVEVSSSIYVYDDEQNVNEGFPEIGEQNGWADMAAVPDLATLRRVAHLDRSRDRARGRVVDAATRGRGLAPHGAAPPGRAGARAPASCPRPPWSTSSTCSARPSSRRGRRATAGCSRCTRRCQDYVLYRAHRDEPLPGAMWRSLVASGIPVDTVKTEMGHGQSRSPSSPPTGWRRPTAPRWRSSSLRQIAAQHGLAATFMARLCPPRDGQLRARAPVRRGRGRRQPLRPRRRTRSRSSASGSSAA